MSPKGMPMPKIFVPIKGSRYIAGLEKGLEKLWKRAENLHLKHFLVVALILLTGCRVGEAVRVKVEDFDFERYTVTIRSLKKKRPEYRVIYITPDTERKKLFWKLLKYHIDREALIEGDYVFFSTHNRKKHITTRWVRYLFYYLSGVIRKLQTWENMKKRRTATLTTAEKKPIHPHAVRHTIATILARASKNMSELRVVQRILGHSSIETTAYYIGVHPNAQKELLGRAFGPKEEEKEENEVKQQ